VVAAVVKRAEAGPRVVRAPMPRWLDYVSTAETWIKALNVETAATADSRWEGEREVRDKIGVPIGERSRLRALLDRKLAQLAPKESK
jgi:hypothetical protein